MLFSVVRYIIHRVNQLFKKLFSSVARKQAKYSREVRELLKIFCTVLLRLLCVFGHLLF